MTRIEVAAVSFLAGALAATCCCLASIALETRNRRTR